MFASKVGAYLSEASFRCSTQGYGSAEKISEDLKVKYLDLFIFMAKDRAYPSEDTRFSGALL
jgi:hypothetical protein